MGKGEKCCFIKVERFSSQALDYHLESKLPKECTDRVRSVQMSKNAVIVSIVG